VEIFQLNDYIEFNDESANKKELFHSSITKAFVINLAPGQAVKPHTHPGKHLIIRVLTGEVNLHCGDKTKAITPEQMVWVHGDDLIGFTNDQSVNTSISVIMHESFIPGK
jgi:quercetin dioxygenase-like cupin family protein